MNRRNGRQMLKRRDEEIATLMEIGKTLTSTLDLQEVLGIIMDKVSNLLKPKAWSLLLADEHTDELVFEIAVSEVAQQLSGVRLAKGHGVAGWVAEHGEALLIPDVTKDNRFASEYDQAFSFTTRSIVCIPVRSRDRILGVIELINSLNEESFDYADQRILSTIADFAAIAIENVRSVEKINNLVITDDLTGLYNSRHFHELVEYEIERARRYATELSLVFLDLDHFKSINDTHGHLVGSRLLSEIGRLIKRNIRKADKAARYGGDEFVIVLPQTSKQGAFSMVSNLRRLLREQHFLEEMGTPLQITASFGIASFPEDADNRLELIGLADKAMYEVKEGSRDGVKMASRIHAPSEGQYS